MFRILVLSVLSILTAASVVLQAFSGPGWWVAVVIFGALLVLAVADVAQKRHSILRIYPVLGHMRFAMEYIRPELQQYFIERNYDGRPFDRDTRSLIYERSKGTNQEQAFGTERDVNEVGYEYLAHSTAPLEPPAEAPMVLIGGPDSTQPYDMALLNVSAMSFGALSSNAILALNKGAAMGGFAHDTGEGGLTEYHLRNGGDLVWEIGSGYFGTRTKDGHFDPQMFADKAAHRSVKCLSLKLSQGADYTNAARAMMMATGCIQAQLCHTNKCPVGVAAQDPRRAQALDVESKSLRVQRFQEATVSEALRMMASMGAAGPEQLTPLMMRRRIGHLDTKSYAELYNWLAPGQLLSDVPASWTEDWATANPDSFAPQQGYNGRTLV